MGISSAIGTSTVVRETGQCRFTSPVGLTAFPLAANGPEFRSLPAMDFDGFGPCLTTILHGLYLPFTGACLLEGILPLLRILRRDQCHKETVAVEETQRLTVRTPTHVVQFHRIEDIQVADPEA